MVDRVKAAVDARTDDQFVIMARTDAAAAEGIDSAIERAVAYVEAGADMIFPEAMKTLDDYRRFKAAVKVPILANLTEFGSTPLFTVDELREANVDIALYCCGAYRAMNKAALNFTRRCAATVRRRKPCRRCRRVPSCTTSSVITNTSASSTSCSRRAVTRPRAGRDSGERCMGRTRR